MGDFYYMGDMAEFAFNEAMDYDDLILQYHIGEINDTEAYDLGLIDELGNEYHTIANKGITCRCCGVKNLRWQQVNNKWLLHEGENLHDCKVNPYRPSRMDSLA